MLDKWRSELYTKVIQTPRVALVYPPPIPHRLYSSLESLKTKETRVEFLEQLVYTLNFPKMYEYCIYIGWGGMVSCLPIELHRLKSKTNALASSEDSLYCKNFIVSEDLRRLKRPTTTPIKELI